MAYIVVEKDVAVTIRDFIGFCEYIKNNNPTATQAGALSVKPCFEVNQLLSCPEEYVKPNSRMNKYGSVTLWFHVAKEAGLIDYSDRQKNKIVFDVTPKYNAFKCMNVFSQYLFIFYTWIRFVNPEEIYDRIGIFSFDTLFDDLSKSEPSKWQTLGDSNQSSFFSISPIQMLLSMQYNAAVNLMDLGLVECERGVSTHKGMEYPIIKKLKPTLFGTYIMKTCETRRHSWFNEYTSPIVSDKEVKLFECTVRALEEGKESFLAPFISLFPKGSVNEEAIAAIFFEYAKEDNCVFDFKVSFGKGFSCMIRCSSGHSFEDLHLKIQEAVAFNNDRLYSFYLNGKKNLNNAINAPYSNEPPYTDETLLGEVRLYNNQRILYLFDYGDQWQFNIIVKTSTEAIAPAEPELIQVTGRPPEQYPDYGWEE